MNVRDVVRRKLLEFLFPPLEVRISGVLGHFGHMPTQGYSGDAGWDLYTSHTVTIPGRSFMDVHTGVRVALPDGVWIRITGRSSTVRKWKLQVQEGIIDNGYRGELFIGVWNLTDQPITVPHNTRLAQVIPARLVQVGSWIKVLDEDFDCGSGRGDRGFGSSGEGITNGRATR